MSWRGNFCKAPTAERPGANLDLAIARFFTEGPVSALAALEQTPDGDQSGDYWLLKASLLDSAGRGGEAEQILRRGLSAPISRPAIVQAGGVVAVAAESQRSRARPFEQGKRLRSGTAAFARQSCSAEWTRRRAAEKALKEIESEWPEWDRPYLAHGLLLERSQPREAGRKLRTAIALGSQDPAARCALARLGADDTFRSAMRL